MVSPVKMLIVLCLLVLANVVISTVLLVNPFESFVSSVGHIFLVQGPRDMLVLKKVNYRGDILRDCDEWITIEAKIISVIGQYAEHSVGYEKDMSDLPSNSSHIVRLTWVCHSKVVAQRDTLLCEELKVGYICE